MTPPEVRNPITISPEKTNLVEAHDRNFKIAIIHLFKDLKEDMDKYLNEDHENSNG